MNVLVTLVSTWYGAQLDVYGVQLEIDNQGQASYTDNFSDSGLTEPVALWDTDGNQHQPEGYSVPPGLKVLWHIHVLPETSVRGWIFFQRLKRKLDAGILLTYAYR